MNLGLAPMNDLNKKFVSTFLSHFAHLFQLSGTVQYFTPSELGRDTDSVWRAYMRPGLEAFVKRIISRMLMMVDLRYCDERPEVPGWHKHGGRDYYTAAVGFEDPRKKSKEGCELVRAQQAGRKGSVEDKT